MPNQWFHILIKISLIPVVMFFHPLKCVMKARSLVQVLRLKSVYIVKPLRRMIVEAVYIIYDF